ncbi:hypothetical protein F4776DRAFT_657276 [Hypoxylon sp. NC0597]|nr:hypothetical protein F4776DRAFT_657276 [Hypoxylon sp. NC0597]
MFAIDRSLLPSLATRRALIVVDPQNDFLSEGGALPVKYPMDLPDRIASLATGFRQGGGDIIWVCSLFEKTRSALDEQILTSDRSSNPRSADASRGRRRQTPPQTTLPTECPEAYLTQESPNMPKCVRPMSPGIEMHPTIKGVVGPRDYSISKSYYSAFRSEQLLRILRMRLVTELYICGATTNISVMATAVDAASHGYTITIVDDCCGYHHMLRHCNALKQISNTTGCDILPAADVLASLKPKPKVSRKSGDRPATSPAGRFSTVRRTKGEDSAASSTSDILSSFENLSLSDKRAADTPKLEPSTENAPMSIQPLVRSKSAASGRKSRVDPRILISGEVDSAQPHHKPKSSPENASKPTGTVSDIPNEKYPERTEMPLEDPRTKINNSSIMASANYMTTSRESKPMCEGDTTVIYDVLPPPLSENIFERLRDEVQWQRMFHQGGEVPRLVAVQGQVDPDGSMPLYRHPADESPPLLPFSPTVLEIKEVVEKHLGHSLNHVLIQFYRGGNDYISEHSDKTLDIAKDSFIANVSLGAARTMTFRTKRQRKSKVSTDAKSSTAGLGRETQRAPLPHNSLCKMGLITNMRWLHSIRQDKRMDSEKSDEELAYGGGRISLTFRKIGTFLDREGRLIWGQGATAKTREAAKPVINGQTPEAIKMLRGFGRENQLTEFDWDEYYGDGFDVLHISTAPRLFLSSDPIVNMRIQLMLAEYEISYARGSMSPTSNGEYDKPAQDPNVIPEDLPIKFIDYDFMKIPVQGEVAIMLYLDRVYGQKQSSPSRRDLAKEFTRFQQALSLLEKHRARLDTKTFNAELRIWEAYASEGDDFIAGNTMTLADYAFWPVLYDIIRLPGQYAFSDGEVGFENLKRYHDRIRNRESG